MASDPRYVSAVSAIFPAIVELISGDPRVRDVTEAIVHAYVAIVRALTQQDNGWPPDLAWPDN